MSTLIGSLIDTLTRRPEACALVASAREKRAYGTALRNLLLDSHRFHLSSKTAQVASSLGFETKDSNVLMSLARPMFDNVWLEWNLADQFSAAGQTPADDAPSRVGCLVQHFKGNQYVVTSVLGAGVGRGEVVMSPVSILIDPDAKIPREGDLEEMRDAIAVCVQHYVKEQTGRAPSVMHSKKIMDACLIGGQIDAGGIPLAVESLNMMDHGTHIFTPKYAEAYLIHIRNRFGSLESPELAAELAQGIASIIGERVTEASGLMRFVVGALALMNSKEYVTRQAVKPTDKKAPPEAAKTTVKRSPTYDFVEFVAPHQVLVRDIIEANTTDEEPGTKRPQHEVIGHFAHSRKLGRLDCEHNYERRGENSWICLNCGKKRWFRKEHKRGDPNIGIVEHKDRVVLT